MCLEKNSELLTQTVNQIDIKKKQKNVKCDPTKIKLHTREVNLYIR